MKDPNSSGGPQSPSSGWVLAPAGKLRPVPHDPRRVALVTPLAAVALGGLDLLLQKILPYPWANLANSSAVWAIAAWFLGRWIGTPRWLAAVAGATLLILAVPSYYLAATIFQNDDITMIRQPAALLWMAFGLLAGVVFGFGGSLALSTGW